ncbi:TRAP transporter small permease subunit [Castellaniella sp. UC4442_H9]|jgi:TRAP-type mannitol/chloroaromatic compound transport system permease small subunit|nr:TRAP transporter small permease subunit [Castellaniella sp.]
MNALLALSRAIDSVNRRVGRAVTWLILLAVLISATNATVRKLFNVSSNAWLELQWYLFGAVFMLASGYTLLKNEHVRVDVLASRFSRRTQLWIEIFGVLFFLLPACSLIMWLSWPYFMDSLINNEQSSNAGGLIRWPAKLILPVGFALLVAAGVSHLIKCIGCLRGLCPDPRDTHTGKSAEEELAEEIAREALERGASSHEGK